MKALKPVWTALALLLAGCGGPVPSGMFLTMSVSTREVAVVTTVNGKPNDFLSGDSGSMSASIPLNKLVHEGENDISFLLTPVGDDVSDPGFFASLEISLKGEMVDTLAPGERTLFTRELTEAETASLAAGDSVTITERFTVDKAKLAAIKSGGATQ